MAHADAEARRRYHCEYMRRYRQRNPEYVEKAKEAQRRAQRKDPVAHARRERARRRQFWLTDPRGIAVREMRDRGCEDCGWYPGCGWGVGERVDLDHVRGTKLFGLNEAASHTLEEVLAELEKCEPRCRRCHRERHAEVAA